MHPKYFGLSLYVFIMNPYVCDYKMVLCVKSKIVGLINTHANNALFLMRIEVLI